jgi:hypothetical protein
VGHEKRSRRAFDDSKSGRSDVRNDSDRKRWLAPLTVRIRLGEVATAMNENQ